MKGDAQKPGFTIVEVMIFLAVSGALFISVMALISGQQQKTEFSQGIRDLQGQIQDTLNDVTTGYYSKSKAYTCTAPIVAGPPSFSTTSQEQGANLGCIFVGRALQFNSAQYIRYTIAGRQFDTSLPQKNVSTLTDANIVPIASTTGGIDDTETIALPYGIKVLKMQYTTGVVATSIGAVGFFSTFDHAASSSSGTQAVDLVPIPGTDLTQNKSSIIPHLSGLKNDGSNTYITDAVSPSPTTKNPDGGVRICFISGGSSEVGVITIGGKGNGPLNAKLDLYDKASSAPGGACT